MNTHRIHMIWEKFWPKILVQWDSLGVLVTRISERAGWNVFKIAFSIAIGPSESPDMMVLVLRAKNLKKSPNQRVAWKHISWNKNLSQEIPSRTIESSPFSYWDDWFGGAFLSFAYDRIFFSQQCLTNFITQRMPPRYQSYLVHLKSWCPHWHSHAFRLYCSECRLRQGRWPKPVPSFFPKIQKLWLEASPMFFTKWLFFKKKALKEGSCNKSIREVDVSCN